MIASEGTLNPEVQAWLSLGFECLKKFYVSKFYNHTFKTRYECNVNCLVIVKKSSLQSYFHLVLNIFH